MQMLQWLDRYRMGLPDADVRDSYPEAQDDLKQMVR